MKKTRIWIAGLLMIAMMFSLVACGDSPNSTPPASSEANSSDLKDHSLAYTLLGEDWMLSYYESEAEWSATNTNPNNKYQYVNAEFTSDMMVSGVQSLISSGVDGYLYYGAFPVLNLTISEMSEDAKVPFGMPDQMPTDEQRAEMLANPYFIGGFGGSSYEVGYQIGVYAAQQGYSKAIVIGGIVGDAAHDGRLSGFAAGFATGGGVVLGEARCSGPAEAVTKASDLLAAYPEADCTYAATGAYAGGMITAQQNYGRDIMNFSTDIDKDLLAYVRSGDLIGDGGGVIVVSLTMCLLQNYLDGHPILDNGKAPINTDLVNFLITPENVDKFEELFVSSHPLTTETLQSLLWRYNNDVTYEDYCNLVSNWTLEYAESLR